MRKDKTLEDNTLNKRLSKAGITTIETKLERVYRTLPYYRTISVKKELQYNGKTIPRPPAEHLIQVCKEKFGIDI